MSLIIVFNLTSNVGDWTINTHSRHGSQAHSKNHVHISKRGLKGQYSWNIDGTRHDQHRFSQNEDCIKRAKELAASTLGVPIGILQLIIQLKGAVQLSIQDNLAYQQENKKILNTYVHKVKVITLFGSDKGLVVVIDYL